MRKIAFSIVALVALAGCVSVSKSDATAGRGGNRREQFTVPNPEDWQLATEKCVDALAGSGVLTKKDGGKAVVAVGTVKDTTWWPIDETLFARALRLSLLRSGKALSTSLLPSEGKDTGSALRPDFKLDGKIAMRQRKLDGKAIPPEFVVHLKLTDLRTKLVTWEDVVPVEKR